MLLNLEALRAGDPSEWHRFTLHYQERLSLFFSMRLAKTVNMQTVEDLTQETLLRCYRGFPSANFADVSRLSPWVKKIARHLAVDRLRKLAKDQLRRPHNRAIGSDIDGDNVDASHAHAYVDNEWSPSVYRLMHDKAAWLSGCEEYQQDVSDGISRIDPSRKRGLRHIQLESSILSYLMTWIMNTPPESLDTVGAYALHFANSAGTRKGTLARRILIIFLDEYVRKHHDS